MGATYIEDHEILAVIKYNCAKLDLEPMPLEQSQGELAIQSFFNLLPNFEPHANEQKNYDGSFETETREGSGAKKEDIERHIFSEFKKGLIHEKGEDEGVVFLSSSVVKFAEEPFAYSLFRWFLAKPENEWIDGFLFEVADRKPDIVGRLNSQEQVKKFRKRLQQIGSSIRSIDRDDAIYSAKFNYSKEEMLVLESLRGMKEQSHKVAQSLDALSLTAEIPRIEFGAVSTTSDFVENSFFKRRLSEHASNQSFVRKKLKPFFEKKSQK